MRLSKPIQPAGRTLLHRSAELPSARSDRQSKEPRTTPRSCWRLAALTLLIFGGPASTAFAAAPSNDHFANRMVLTGTNVVAQGSSAGATREPTEPLHHGVQGGASIWWRWTAPQDADVWLDTDGSGFDTLLAVYTGSSLDRLDLVASSDDDGDRMTSRLLFGVRAGVEYQVVVDGFNGESGAVTLHLTFASEPVSRPANDLFEQSAVLLGEEIAVTASNVNATREATEPRHAGEIGFTSVWWTWTAPHAAIVEITTEGSGFDTLLGIYQGSAVSGLAVVASNDDIDQAAGTLTSAVALVVQAGATYQIAVDGFHGESGPISLRIRPAAPWLSGWQVLPDRVFHFTLNCTPGRTYRVQTSPDLQSWTPWLSFVSTNLAMSVTDPSAPASHARRFYRALEP